MAPRAVRWGGQTKGGEMGRADQGRVGTGGGKGRVGTGGGKGRAYLGFDGGDEEIAEHHDPRSRRGVGSAVGGRRGGGAGEGGDGWVYAQLGDAAEEGLRVPGRVN